MLRILINGIGGQMGRNTYAACAASGGEYVAVAGVDLNAAQLQGAFACPVYASFDEVTEEADAIIDFSVPAALPAILRFAQKQGVPAVIGTTGLSEKDVKLIHRVSERVPLFQTGNMSLGVNLQLSLARQATAALGSEFDVEIIEKHHRRKIDAPSGTALMLADAVASQFPTDMDYVCGRHEKNKRRTDTEIGIHSIRGGTIVGEHEVLFAGNDEILEITHRAFSKQVFVRGALRAAKFLAKQPNGCYSMQDVVTEHNVASHLLVKEEQAVVTLAGLLNGSGVCSRVFAAVAAAGIFVDMIALSQPCESGVCISFSLDEAQLQKAMDAVAPFASAEEGVVAHACAHLVKLTVEGPGMALRHGVAAQLFDVLRSANILLRLVTTSETKIEFCIDAVKAERAIAEVQAHFLDLLSDT